MISLVYANAMWLTVFLRLLDLNSLVVAVLMQHSEPVSQTAHHLLQVRLTAHWGIITVMINDDEVMLYCPSPPLWRWEVSQLQHSTAQLHWNLATKGVLIKRNLLFILQNILACRAADARAKVCTFLFCRTLLRLRGARTHARTLLSDLLPCDARLVVKLTLSKSDRGRDRRDQTEVREKMRMCVSSRGNEKSDMWVQLSLWCVADEVMVCVRTLVE